jgi:uncharacterized membrane protein YphA (DoxX/SURF4 family)
MLDYLGNKNWTTKIVQNDTSFGVLKQKIVQQMKPFIQLFTRAALGIGFLVPGLDRFGVWGAFGAPGISWGDWQHFMQYAQKLLFFLPYPAAETAAFIASVAEIVLGLLLLAGWKTRFTAIASGTLLLCFALCMWAGLGFRAPLNYSVFSAGAAAFLLSTYTYYHWSVDALLDKKAGPVAPALANNAY